MQPTTIRLFSAFTVILLMACRQAEPTGQANLPEPTIAAVTESPPSTTLPTQIAATNTAVPINTTAPTLSPTPSTTATATAPPTPTLDPHWWIGSAPMPAPRGETGAGLIDGRIYVPAGMFGFRYSGTDIVGILGTNSLAIYDIQTDSWEKGAVVPFEGLNHQATAVYDGKLFTFGGLGPDELLDKLVLVYDPVADSWSRLPDMPETRQSATAVTLGDYIYIVGGAGTHDEALLRYQPDSGDWALMATMQGTRDHVAAVVLNGEIYAIGGRVQNPLTTLINDLTLVEIYNPESNSWRTGPSLHFPRAGFAAAVIDSKIYVAGGELLSHKPADLEPSIEMFDPELNHWQVIGEMPVPLHGVSSVAAAGKFYMLAGSNRAGIASPFPQIVVFTPDPIP